MMAINSGYRRIGFRALLVLMALLWSGRANLAAAAEVWLGQPACHAVTALHDMAVPDFTCRGAPTGYQQGSLWFRVDLRSQPTNRNDLVLMVGNSRFDRLAVAFTYADGVVTRQQVRRGNFGLRWRAGGQIEFDAPMRAAPLVGMTMRFDRLASASLLRMRLMPRDVAAMQSAALSALLGGALMLLLVGALYNVSLAVAVRRQFPAWQGAWAGCMFVWGAAWSQLHLFFLPGLAGTASAQFCTALSCLAIALATLSAITALNRAALPVFASGATLAVGCGIGVLGIPLALMRSGNITLMADLLGLLVLADLIAVALCLGWAWRRGSVEARAFAGAWSLPMLALGATEFVPTDMLFWGGGSQILVLFAAAWQTLWLSGVATRVFARIRIERDRARAAEASAFELALRDPLTGLRNRRGFIQAVAPMLDRLRADGGSAGLLLIDIDRFKSINDSHGHEAGDVVLSTIGRRLNRWDGPMCTVARFGGEEFALLICGVEGFALANFAEGVRTEIAACDHRSAIGPGPVTVSIGVAETSVATDFQQLYRLADEALYAAKGQGRDQVVVRNMPFNEAETIQASVAAVAAVATQR